ncbi:MAG: hypothetical protein WB392_07890 [Methanotrichaceae archaeon]
MKILVLMLAAMAMIGFAAAWDTTEQMQYTYQKTVDTQADQHLDWLDGTYSSASFGSQTGYGQSSGYMDNGVSDLTADLQPVNGLLPDTHNSLTQSGSAVATTSAPNLEDPSGIQYSGQASTSEDIHLSGNYADASALFNQYTGTGMNSWGCGNSNELSVYGYSNPYSTGWTGPSVETDGCNAGNTRFVEADLGQSMSIGYQQLNAPGADPTMSGMSGAWAGFSGAYTTNGASSADIQTNAVNSANFDMYKYNWGCPI